MKIVAISDTHKYHHQIDLPDGDVLVHAGDITPRGAIGDVNNFSQWLGKQDQFEYKIVIAGNHDYCFEDERRQQAIDVLKQGVAPNVIYLEDESVTINGVTFHGSPWTPYFHGWAFNIKEEDDMYERFNQARKNTDILITHGPPYGILDRVARSRPGEDPHVGSMALKDVVEDIEPKHHVFGHIHEAYGQEEKEDVES